MKVVSSFHGLLGSHIYGIVSVYILHACESKARPCGIGELFQISEKMPWPEICDAVAMGKIMPELPEFFKCIVLRSVTTRIKGALVEAKIGETIEVQGSPEVARMIACGIIRPLDANVWWPVNCQYLAKSEK